MPSFVLLWSICQTVRAHMRSGYSTILLELPHRATPTRLLAPLKLGSSGVASKGSFRAIAPTSGHGELLARFPKLGQAGHAVTSPKTYAYNCVAWVFGDTSRWWQPEKIPGYYWPPGISRDP